MDSYDPDIAPDPAAWLALAEPDRLGLVSDYHVQHGEPPERVVMHASIHAVVENQLAERYEPAVSALARLRAEGLGRHDAIHAIGSVLAEQMWGVVRGSQPDPADAYERELRLLTAKRWRERYGGG